MSQCRFPRRWLFSLAGLALVPATGCFSPWFTRDSESSNSIDSRREAIRDKLESEERPTLVAQIGSPSMLTQSQLQNIGLVTQLIDTGGKVKSSQQREKLLDAMRVNEAYQPNAVLDDPSTTMVVASVAVPPAASKGDTLDVSVTLSMHASATDLEHGRLLDTPLMEMSRIGGQVREGFERTIVRGNIVTKHQMNGSTDPKSKLEGIVIGGGTLLKSRSLGISIDQEFADAITMNAIVPAINKRFTYFDGRKQTGIATPREDSYIEIVVPPRYRLDPFHFLHVVLHVSFNESETKRIERIETLKRQLLEPTTVRTACWQLEALGEQAIPILAQVLDHENPEIRFYAAHSLAYLNDPQAIPALVNLCRSEVAFRAMCLNSLVVLDSYEAADALSQLVHAADPEVKYGAVLSLRKRDAGAPEVNGEKVFEAGSILEIPSSGPPLVAVSLSQKQEVVLFGENPTLHIPTFQYVNQRIIVSPGSDGGLVVSHFSPGKDDQVISTTADLRSTLTAIAEVGGRYGDWVNFLRECNQNGYFVEPFALNPVPMAGRTYHRIPTTQVEPGESLYETTLINPLNSPDDSASSSKSNSVWYNPFSWGS